MTEAPAATTSLAHADEDPKAALSALDARLQKIGAPRVEGEDKVGDKAVADGVVARYA